MVVGETENSSDESPGIKGDPRDVCDELSRFSHGCVQEALYPLTETLNEEWKLELGGLWGYVFNYMANKLCFYQLEKQESFGPFSVSHAYLCGLGGVVFK